MKTAELTLKLILQKPLQSVAYGIQKGRSPRHEVIQVQVAKSSDLLFEFNIEARMNKEGAWTLQGPYIQGPPNDRFFYIGIGTFAGQRESPWSRRLKIPLVGITELLPNDIEDQMIFETHVPGIGKDGSPNCATVKPFEGWTLIPAIKKQK
jgi:hypothetical protein